MKTRIVEKERNVGQLVEILKLIEDPEPHLLELLHTICEKSDSAIPYLDSVLVSCSLHPAGHKVGSGGFELLELVEEAMGTTLQVEEFEWEELNENFNSFESSLILALLARINRQKKPLKKIRIRTVLLLANTGITALLVKVH